ncbi:MAG: CehA/McbA family metallohydrolase [Bacteroidales bacterium]
MKLRLMAILLISMLSISITAQTSSIGGFNVYYGSLHNHCNHSDGVGTADQAYNYAKNTAGLDFFSLADHAEAVSSTEWAATKTAANAYNQDGVFTAFWGFEWSHSTQGHVAVINSDDYCASNQTATNTFTNFLGWLSTRECVAYFNHPGRQNSTGVEFNHFTNPPSDKFVGMELWNKNDLFDQYYYTDGYYPNDGNLSWYDEALVRGWQIGAGGAEDNHTGDWGTRTTNRMAILASNLTRTDLYNAMKERRFFTTTDMNLALSFKINGSEMGSSIIGGYYNLLIQASDGNGELFTKVDLLKNGQVIQTWLPNQAIISITQAISVLDGDYYYIRVKQTDGDEAISSPIHISGNTNLPPVVQITNPSNGSQYTFPQQITITATASDPDGTISQVEFLINGLSIGTDQSAPYSMDWTVAADNTNYTLTAIATDNQYAAVSSDPVQITVGTPPIITSSRISSGGDDVEEHANGSIYVNSTDVELVYDGSRGNQVVGLRFQGLQIPGGANITGAYIQFTTDEVTTGATALTIRGHASDNSQPFSTATYDVSSRTTTAGR